MAPTREQLQKLNEICSRVTEEQDREKFNLLIVELMAFLEEEEINQARVAA